MFNLYLKNNFINVLSGDFNELYSISFKKIQRK